MTIHIHPGKEPESDDSSISGRKARALLLTFVMVVSLPAMCLVGGLDSGTAKADGTNPSLETQPSIMTQASGDDVVYSASQDNTVKAIDATDGTEIWSFEGHSSDVYSVAPSVDGEVVYTGSDDNTVKAIDANNGTEIWSFDGHSGTVTSVSPSAFDGEAVYSGSEDGTVRAIDASNGSEIWQQTVDTEFVRGISASPDEEVVYAGVFGNEVIKLDGSDGSEIWTFNGHTDSLRSVASSTDGEVVYSASDDGTARAIDASDGTEIWSYDGYGASVFSIVPSPDGDHVYTGSSSPTEVKKLDATDGTEIWESSAHNGTVQSVYPSSDGSQVYSGSSDGVKALDTLDGSEIWIFGGHAETVRSVAAPGIYEPTIESITGQVVDQDDEPVSGATVTFRNVASGDETEVETDGSGTFRSRLEDGRYEIEISADGYQTFTDTRDISPGDELGTFQLESQQLELQFNRYVEPGTSTPYEVDFVGDNGTAIDVTANVTMNSSNTSIAFVDTEEVEIVGSSGVNGTSVITANYTVGNETYTDTRTVTVATKTVDNLEILPGTWRLSALLDDTTIQIILIGILTAIVATRVANSWAGLGAMEFVMIIGWFGDWVPLGIMLVGLFTALFIGLNLAANIDYTIRR